MRILLTGASGLIGGELAGMLAARGHAVTALLHHGREVRRNDGSVLPTQPWNEQPRPAAAGLLSGPATVSVLSGNVAEKRLGLDPTTYEALRDGLDLIVHLAAVTAFDAAPALLRAVNIDGTTNILALAAGGTRRVPLLHVSTAYVCGEVSGAVAEDDATGAGRFTNGYEASKAEAEGLVEQARRDGLPVVIARPSIVVGAYGDGMIGRLDGVYALIRLVAEGRVRTLPVTTGASLDLVPIDHVTAGLLHLAERMEQAAGRNVHLVSGRPVPVAMLAGLAAEYPHFATVRLVPPDQFDASQLTPRGAVVHRQVTAHYTSYLQRDPRFLDDNLRALGGSPCPPTDVAFLRRLVDRCIRTGYLRAA